MAGAAKVFRFEDFDAPVAAAAPKPAPAPDPRALERARADGVAEGRRLAELAYADSAEAAAQEEALARTEAMRSATEAFAALRATAEAAYTHVERATARLAAACLQRLIADLGEPEAHRRAAAFARQIAQSAADQAQLTVRVGAGAADAARDALQTVRTGAIAITVDEDLDPYAVEADWTRGSARYDAMADAAWLETALDRACAALSDTPPPETRP